MIRVKILSLTLLLFVVFTGCKKSDQAPDKHTVKYFALITGGTLNTGNATYMKDDYNATSEDMTTNLRTITANTAYLWEKTVTLSAGTNAEFDVVGDIKSSSGRLELTIEIDGKKVSTVAGVSKTTGNLTVIGGTIQWVVPK